MRLPRTLLAAILGAGCGSSNVTIPDAAVPLDMSIAAPTTLGAVQTLTNCLAADGSFVYWSDGTPAVMKVPVKGGTPIQVVAGGDKNTCVAVDGNGIYYVDADQIMMAPLSGGGASPLASGQHVLKGAPIFVHGGFVYWITDVYGNVDAYNGMNAVVRVPTTTNNSIEVIVTDLIGNPGGLAVDDTNVYYSDQSGVFARPLAAPATSTPFGQSSLHGNAIAVGANTLAMNEIAAIGSGDVAVFRTDGNARTVVSPSLAQPLAVDDKGVYINGAGALERLALDGSGATLLAIQPPRAVVLSTSTIFFTDGTAIYSLSR
ncbi:MAG TPA: hypothetical protein VGH63_07260 [Polyangia bacterium]